MRLTWFLVLRSWFSCWHWHRAFLSASRAWTRCPFSRHFRENCCDKTSSSRWQEASSSLQRHTLRVTTYPYFLCSALLSAHRGVPKPADRLDLYWACTGSQTPHWHPDHMPETPQLAPFDAEEQTKVPILITAASHSTAAVMTGCWFPVWIQFHSFPSENRLI